jgi:uncharacterized protein HemY
MLAYAALHPEEPETSLYLGRNYYWLGDQVKARQYLQAALTKDPGNKQAKEWLGQVPR